MGGIAYLLSWIDFLRWHILYHVIKVMLLLMLLIYSFEKLYACMVCQILLSQIVILNFLVTFGDVYGLKMYCRIVEKVEHGTSLCLMMDLCSVLTSYAFQLALFVFCCCRRRMEED